MMQSATMARVTLAKLVYSCRDAMQEVHLAAHAGRGEESQGQAASNAYQGPSSQEGSEESQAHCDLQPRWGPCH